MRVLFMSPKVANIYLDIISELERQGYEVDYYDYPSYRLDPYYLKGYVKYGRLFTSKMISSYFIKRNWKRMLASEQYNRKYDYLFVVDGYSLHPYLFETLKARNPNIKTVNYLFDSTYSNYEFNVHFPYFDKVATFDLKDSDKYKIELLPIYWIDDHQKTETDLFFFGHGSDIGPRFHLFEVIEKYAIDHQLKSYIKIYLDYLKDFKRYKIKFKLIETLSSISVMTPPEHYLSSIVTHDTFSTSDYRKMIKSAKVIIDSNAPHQDGLTARFMWALGAEKRIVTTNAAVRRYDFYTPEQIFIVDDIDSFTESKEFEQFINADYNMPDSIRQKIERYRIDNWVDELIGWEK